MLYTITLNPALDYYLEVPEFQAGTVNRSSRECIRAGGKGINVSRMLQQLGVESTAVYWGAGSAGKQLAELLQQENLTSREIRLEKGSSRINVKIRTDKGEETAVNASGPPVSAADQEKLFSFLRESTPQDMYFLSGSIPRALPSSFYADMASVICSAGARFILDAEGEALLSALPYRPLFIKPNRDELASAAKMPLHTLDDIARAAALLQERGARHVLVSLGAEGAVLLGEDGRIFYAEAPAGEVLNTVGAGDAMAAGFWAALAEGKALSSALAWGTAAGSASAFSAGAPSRAFVCSLYKQVQLTEIFDKGSSFN